MKVTLLGGKDSINASRKPALLCHGTSASTVALSVLELLQSGKIKNPILVCPSDDYSANLEDALEFFSKFLELKPPNICSVESPSSPYSRLLPVPQERWQRIAALSGIRRDQKERITILPVTAALKTQISPKE